MTAPSLDTSAKNPGLASGGVPKELTHWHPVMLSRDLGQSPRKVELLGRPIALFRPGKPIDSSSRLRGADSSTQPSVAAVSDICPHRRMSLSAGEVRGHCLECCYHGWTFDAVGRGESPGTPKMHAQMEYWETTERHGLIWLRAPQSPKAAEFEAEPARQSSPTESGLPEFDGREHGYQLMAQLVHDMEAPLECVLDNFTELEHTPTTHGMFGYQLERMNEVELNVEQAEDHLTIRYRGPCKTYPWLSRKFLGLSKQVWFHVVGKVHYAPLYVYGDYHWTDERTGQRSPVGVRNVHLLTPLTEGRTRVVTMSYMRSDDRRRERLLPLARPFVRRTINTEVMEDKRVLDGLADKSPDIRGLKLSRFDRVVGLHRQRLAAIYRGRSVEQSPVLDPES